MKETITFSSDAWLELKKLLDFKGKIKCVSCGKVINKKNIAVIIENKKVYCRNTFCVIESVRLMEKQNE